ELVATGQIQPPIEGPDPSRKGCLDFRSHGNPKSLRRDPQHGFELVGEHTGHFQDPNQRGRLLRGAQHLLGFDGRPGNRVGCLLEPARQSQVFVIALRCTERRTPPGDSLSDRARARALLASTSGRSTLNATSGSRAPTQIAPAVGWWEESPTPGATRPARMSARVFDSP